MKILKKTASPVSAILLSAFSLFFLMQDIFAGKIVGYSYNDKCLESGDWLYYDRGSHICICGYTGLDESITIPSEINGKKVTEISDRAHKKNDMSGENKRAFFDSVNKVTKEVIVPEGINLIGHSTFNESRIEKITLPESLKEIEGYAFYRCKALKAAEIPKNVKIIGERAFYCSGLEEITLKEGLEIIEINAFSTTPLKAVNIPSTVVEIGAYAFSSTEIEEVILPKNLVTVKRGVFDGCGKLKRACISEGTMVLEADIFDNCQSLEEVYFPSTLISVSKIFYNDMHNGNIKLKNLHFASDEKNCSILLNGSAWNTLFDYKDETGTAVDEAYRIYKSLNITYNTPVPEHVPVFEPAPAEKGKSGLDSAAIIFIVITALGFLCTVIFLCMLIKTKKQAITERSEHEGKKEKDFQPEVLGAWRCERCGAVNGPIANFCYLCGRKRQD